MSENIYSVKTSTKDDRCFVTTDGSLWFCSAENYKLARSVKLNSSQLADFSCPHIDEVVKTNCQLSLAVAYLKPDLERFVASEFLKSCIKEVINGEQSVQHVALQISETMFCIYGPATASNPLGFCHVRRCFESSQFICTGKDCQGFAAKGKQTKTKSMCIHVSIMCACFSGECSSDVKGDMTDSSNEGDMFDSSNESQTELTKCISTLKLAEKIRMLAYELPHDLLDAIAKRDGIDNGWPDCFGPDDAFNCGLYSSPLGDPRTHPGQAQNTPCYLITELTPFKKVEIKVKICLSPACSAMHQASVQNYDCCIVSL